MNSLRDPLFQLLISNAIAIVIGAVTIITSFITTNMQRSKKAISYTILSNTSVLHVDEEIAEKAEITIGGKVIKNASLVVIKLWNSGNTSIVPSDYIEPLHIAFQGTAEILSSDIIEVTPKDLHPSLISKERIVLLEPLLLNQRDSIVLKILTNDIAQDITLSARIIGLQEIVKESLSENKPAERGCAIHSTSLALKTLFALGVLLVLSFAGAVTSPITSVPTETSGVNLLGLLLILIEMGVFSLIGTLLGRGIKTVHSALEGLFLGFVGSFFMGAMLALFTTFGIPATPHINLNWLGTSWYSPLLTLLLIGTPFMFVFLITEERRA